MPLEPLICRSRYGNVKKSYKNQKKFGDSENIYTFVVLKETNSINRSTWNIKNKKIMNLKEPKSKRYVEVYATDNKEVTMVIRKPIEEKGIHETYMDIYDRLMNMGKNAKLDVKVVNVKIYNDEGGL